MTEFTLLLTAWYLPHKILRWQDAITMLYLDKADVLVEYASTVRSPSVTMKLPAVIRARRTLAAAKQGIRFSRSNVYARDGYACQYCGRQLPRAELSYDHVIPRARGGRTEWTNIVTACLPCNQRKAARSCDEVGMWPLKEPRKPKSLPLAPPALRSGSIPDEWDAFLRVWA